MVATRVSQGGGCPCSLEAFFACPLPFCFVCPSSHPSSLLLCVFVVSFHCFVCLLGSLCLSLSTSLFIALYFVVFVSVFVFLRGCVCVPCVVMVDVGGCGAASGNRCATGGVGGAV